MMTDDQLNREIFNEWFQELMLDQDSCLLRDVLRDSKEQLWSNWLKLQPYDLEVVRKDKQL